MDRIRLGFLIGALIMRVALALPDDLHARAAAAIAINEPSNPWYPPKPQPPPTPSRTVATVKPVVTMFTASWCGPCQEAKKQLANADLPFAVELWDIDQRDPPGHVTTLPAFEWAGAKDSTWNYPAKSTPFQQRGFPGVTRLVEMWKATQ